MEKAGQSPLLPPPPPPPTVPPNVKPEQVEGPKRSIISRPGFGNSGRRISLLTNHFKVSLNVRDAVFYQYTVCLSCELLLTLFSVL